MKAFLKYLILFAAMSMAGPVEVKPISTFKQGEIATAERRALLVGKWFGEAKLENGGTRQWIAERFGDGRYRIEFKVESSEGYLNQVEVGRWGVSGKVYFTLLQGWEHNGQIIPADPSDPTIYDAYELLELTAEKMRYRSYETNDNYELRKVSGDFDFPVDA
jgi:hypothetical protein